MGIISVTPKVVGQPTVEPVSVAEFKLAARIDDTRFDAEIPGLLAAAREMAEHETGRYFCEQTLRVELPGWPSAGDVINVPEPTVAVASYWNGSAWATVPALQIVAYAEGDGTVVVPAVGAAWPDLGASAGGARVRIDITTGNANPATVPDAVKTYIKAVASLMLDNPSMNLEDASNLRSRLLDRSRLWT